MNGVQHYQTQSTRLAPGQSREERIRDYLPLVHRLALRLKRNLPASVELQDLVSAGCIGLLSALERFDQERGLDFAVYAEFRIRGAMLDELRKLDPLSRRNRQRYREAEQTRWRLQKELGREPTDEEMAREMKLSVEEWQLLRNDIQPALELSLSLLEIRHQYNDQQRSRQPDQLLQRRQLRKQLLEAVRHLPERLRQIVTLYYYGQLNYREIAQLLGVTESRICQLHRKAVHQIRLALAGIELVEGDV